MIAFLVDIAAYFTDNLTHIKKLMLIRVIKMLGTEVRIGSKNYTAILHMALKAVATVHIGKHVKQIFYCLQVLCIPSKSGNGREEMYIF